MAVYARDVPLGRVGMPQDCANLVRFLCSGQGGWINGQLLYSNGGTRKKVSRWQARPRRITPTPPVIHARGLIESGALCAWNPYQNDDPESFQRLCVGKLLYIYRNRVKTTAAMTPPTAEPTTT